VEPGQPPHPVELDLLFVTEWGTPVNPNHASRTFARLAASVGLAAHPHLLRHALASAMAANKEPASIIATQLRHADGGALAQRVYIHQLPQTAPRLAGLIEGVFGARCAGGTGGASGGGKVEGNDGGQHASVQVEATRVNIRNCLTELVAARPLRTYRTCRNPAGDGEGSSILGHGVAVACQPPRCRVVGSPAGNTTVIRDARHRKAVIRGWPP
jgi:hypothetical protein